MNNRSLRVAIFGTGYWAQFQIAAWQAIGAEVSCVWNRTHERALQTAARFRIPRVCRSPEEAFRTVDFDVADIVTDPVIHEELTLLAVRYGKPVICQKPMAPSLEACERMTAFCEREGIWFAVHENFRFQPQFVLVRKLLDRGVVGEIQSASLNLRSPDRGILAAQPALIGLRHMAYLDMGPHIFDVARVLFGEPVAISSRPVCNYADLCADMADEAYSVVDFASGLSAECNLMHNSSFKAEICGSRGRLVLGWDNVITLFADGQEQTLPVIAEKLSYIPDRDWELHGGHVFAAIPACLKRLEECLRAETEADTSGRDNLKTMRMVYAAIRSAESDGSRVELQG